MPAIIESLPPWCECIIGDNASSDGSQEWLMSIQNQHSALKIYFFSQNYGFAGGNNQLLKYISPTSQYIILLNNDIKVTPGWIEPIISFMEQHPTVAALQPILCSYHEPERYEYAGAAGGYIDLFGYPFCRGRIFNSLESYNPSYTTATNLFWASGAALCVRKSALNQVNYLFNDLFFAHMEEIDLCWRLQRAGYRIAVLSDVKLYHVGGGTLQYQSQTKTYLNFRNNLFLLFLNLPLSSYWRILVRLCLDGIAAFSFLFTQPSKPYKHFIAVIRAHIHFYLHLPKLWKQRMQTRLPFPSLKHLHGVFRSSIVWQYFIKKRTQFSKLPPKKFTD